MRFKGGIFAWVRLVALCKQLFTRGAFPQVAGILTDARAVVPGWRYAMPSIAGLLQGPCLLPSPKLVLVFSMFGLLSDNLPGLIISNQYRPNTRVPVRRCKMRKLIIICQAHNLFCPFNYRHVPLHAISNASGLAPCVPFRSFPHDAGARLGGHAYKIGL